MMNPEVAYVKAREVEDMIKAALLPQDEEMRRLLQRNSELEEQVSRLSQKLLDVRRGIFDNPTPNILILDRRIKDLQERVAELERQDVVNKRTY